MKMGSQRKSIGEFLKNRRSRISPKQFDLPEGCTRRRTPGLRREEVAGLAKVSITWYTWLEQGREISASSEVLERVASVLQLTKAERQYLRLLTGKEAASTAESTELQLPSAFRQLLDHIRYPAFAIGPGSQLVGWNAMACEILTDFSSVPFEEREMLRLAFLHPAFRSRIVNWEQSSQSALSYFRKAYDRYADEAWYAKLVRELKEASREFAEWWPLHEVANKNGLHVEIKHPSMGLLYFEIVTVNRINELENLLCSIYTPVPGTETAEKLDAWFSGAF